MFPHSPLTTKFNPRISENQNKEFGFNCFPLQIFNQYRPIQPLQPSSEDGLYSVQGWLRLSQLFFSYPRGATLFEHWNLLSRSHSCPEWPGKTAAACLCLFPQTCSEGCRLPGLRFHAGRGEDAKWDNSGVIWSQWPLPDCQFLEGRNPMASFHILRVTTHS